MGREDEIMNLFDSNFRATKLTRANIPPCTYTQHTLVQVDLCAIQYPVRRRIVTQGTQCSLRFTIYWIFTA